MLAPHLRPAVFAVGEVIYSRGDRCGEMHFVLDGSVLIHAVRSLVTAGSANPTPTHKPAAPPPAPPPAQRLQASLSHRRPPAVKSAGSCRYGRDRVAGEHIAAKGDIFGEGGLFSSELGGWRRETATALSWVSTYALSAAAVTEISAVYPEVRL
jgi:CRP-like cAMP-binding protein